MNANQSAGHQHNSDSAKADSARPDSAGLDSARPDSSKPDSAKPDESGGGDKVKRSPIMRFLHVLGPGLVTGAADDDASGIATYSQAGATYANSLLWTVPLSLPLMMAVQEICDRTALATGKSLGALVREKFSRRTRVVIGVLIVALILANTLNLAADLVAIGEGMRLLGAGPSQLWSAVAGAAITIALIAGSFEMISKVFKWLCLVLLAYIAVLFVSHVDWFDVLKGLSGIQFRVEPGYFVLIVAVLGTTISPYMFFWQTAQRIEQLRGEDLGGDEAPALRERGARQAIRKLRNSRLDTFTGMTFSVLIMFAIIAATAATLGAKGKPVQTAADAAKALEPVAGDASTILFALGFIASGILAVPVLAASGAAGLAGLLNKNWGLELSPKKAPVFYLLIGFGTIAGIVLSLLNVNPIGLLVLSAVVNGIAAGPFIIIVMLIARDRRLMGKYRNGKLAATLGWGVAVVMCVAGVAGTWFTLTGQ